MSKAQKYARALTMKEWEKSPMDAKMDKSGRHGKEGSPKDMKADKEALAKHNAKYR